jgi:hypothetical protein
MSDAIPETHADAPTPGQSTEPLTNLPERPAPPRRPCAADDDEPLGGDPPCWAHLFEDDPDPATGR